MDFFRKRFFIAISAVVMICAFCGVLSSDEIEEVAVAKNVADVFKDVRADSFARFDGDGKGYMDAREWPGRNRAFRLMDSDRNGRVTLEEFQSLRNRWRNRTFENLDINGNRTITRDEWMDIPEDFDRLDRNKDGMIERHEFYGSR